MAKGSAPTLHHNANRLQTWMFICNIQLVPLDNVSIAAKKHILLCKLYCVKTFRLQKPVSHD